MTPFYGFIIIFVAILFIVLISLFGPLVLCFSASELVGCKKLLAIVGIIIFYPFFIGLLGLMILLTTLLYPCLKNTYHHGIYDPFDQFIATATWGYLYTMGKLWSI